MSDRSEIEIRIVEPEEFAALGVSHYAFSKSPSKPDPEWARKWLKYSTHSQGLAVFEDGKPQTSCAVHTMTENVRGKVFPMGGIGGVATFPQSRRKGHVRKMMARSFELMHEQGMAVSTLYPFRDSFYERLGYAEFAKNRFATLRPEHLAPLLRTSLPGEVEQLGVEECFDEWWGFLESLQPERHGFALFNRSHTVEWRDENEFWVAMVREDGIATGAMSFRITGHTEALVADTFYYTTPAARYQLMAWIARHVDQVSEAVIELGPEEYPELWHRDLAVQSSTEYRNSWPAPMGRVVTVAELGGIAVGSDVSIAVTVMDDRCPWNNGVWTLGGEGGRLVVRQGGDSACHLTIQGLSALVWSGIDPAIFTYRGWGDPDAAAQVTLRAMFPPAFPQLNEKF